MIMESNPLITDQIENITPCSLWQFLSYFLWLGTFGFGGPIALAGYMQRDLVEHKRWVSKEDYIHGLALAQLCQGPLAAQLAMYLGWIRQGVLGASLVAAAFIFSIKIGSLGLHGAISKTGRFLIYLVNHSLS